MHTKTFFQNKSSFEVFLPKLIANDKAINQVTFDNLTDEKLLTLLKTLEKNTCVKSLTLRSCKETKIAQYVAHLLQINQSIQIIDLTCNGIDEINIGLIAMGLINNHTIKSLNIGNNKIGDSGLRLLSFVLLSNKSIQYLNIGDNAIGDKGIEFLCEALASNQSLQALDLGCNELSPKGMELLSNLLQQNDIITTLNFNLQEYYQDPVRWYLKENPIEPLLENNKVIAKQRQFFLSSDKN